MKNIKALALTALAAATTLAPVAKAGYTQDGINFHTADDFQGAYAVIVKQLDQLGVPVVDGRGNDNLCGANDPEKTVLGWYTPDRDFMVICYGDANLRNETLAHEAVHVFQDCRDGLDTPGIIDPNAEQMKIILQHLPKHKENLIVNLYEKEDWKIEAEAFLLETEPATVSTGLSAYCGAASFKF